ncbi:TIGR02594 family protein [Ruegeria atlantica]|uniref:TIGR02594 family protein n=1 Tax=Ruegeria atlantica TaxID=81569 RepID=UPI001479AFE5|nr:TIGR02594 family protein [Ruegeria atlantica]
MSPTSRASIPISAALHAAALGHVGTREWPGARHNPDILAMFEAAGVPMADDETPWCAAFVGAVLAQCGLQGTGKLTARSYDRWGDPIDPADAMPGDIVVFWRVKPDGWQGHTGFLHKIRADGLLEIIGGNHGDAVSIKAYSTERLLSIRRARKPRTNPVQSTTIRASATQIGASAAGATTAVAALDGTAQIIALALASIVALAALWILRERLHKWAAGDR